MTLIDTLRSQLSTEMSKLADTNAALEKMTRSAQRFKTQRNKLMQNDDLRLEAEICDLRIALKSALERLDAHEEKADNRDLWDVLEKAYGDLGLPS